MPITRGLLGEVTQEFGAGSPEYVLAHAWRQQQRGRKPSEPYLDITNPIKAVAAAFADLEAAILQEAKDANSEALRQMFEPKQEYREPDPDNALFGELVGALTLSGGMNIFPSGDAEDLHLGAFYVPGEVTDARQAGDQVTFVQPGIDPKSWYWQMPDGSAVAHHV